MKSHRKLWIGIIILVLLSPIGIILPARFNAGPAWGEWSIEEIQERLGYVPQGMQNSADKWCAPLHGYEFKGQQEATTGAKSVSYFISGLVGVAITVAASYIIGRIISRNGKTNSP